MNIFGITLSISDVWLLRSAGALSAILIASIVRRASIRFIAKRKAHTENISKCVAPFQDAIVNIHYGEHNHIRIMRSFFNTQKEAIAIFKSQCEGKDFTGLQKAWDAYNEHYQNNANGMVHAQFATIPEPFRTDKLNFLHKLLSDITSEIKKT